jgi:hypothetical protein
MEVEPLKNSQVAQQLQRRPRSADASARPTDGFFHSHALGPGDSQSSPKTRRSPSRSTLNSDHPNGALNGSTNGSTAQSLAAAGKSRLATAWNLAQLIRPLPVRQRPRQRQPKLLAHYPAVVEFVHNNRFAVASQVARRFAAWLASPRTAQYQLAALCRLGYLATAPVRSTGPHFPFVYYATSRGAKLVRQAYEQLGQPRKLAAAEDIKTRGQALTSILHELLLTEFALAVQQTVARRSDLELVFSERRFFRRERRLTYTAGERLHSVIPDYGFLVRQTAFSARRQERQSNGGLLYLVEWDNGTMSLSRIFEKYQAYAAWAGSERGSEQLARICAQHGLSTDHANFRLLVVAHDNAREHGDAARMTDMLAEAIELPAAMRDRVWLTTAEAIKYSQIDSRSLDAPIPAQSWRTASTWS